VGRSFLSVILSEAKKPGSAIAQWQSNFREVARNGAVVLGFLPKRFT
jgi:hypothetical protein